MPAAEPTDYAALTQRAMEQAHADLRAAAPPPRPSLTAEQKAENLKQKGMPGYLYGALAGLLGHDFDVETFGLYLDGFLREAGSPADPVERMLLEQLALAHHVIGRLHVRAGCREGLEELKAYHAAAARLLAEFRRTALALKTYREPVAVQQAQATREGLSKGKGSRRPSHGLAAGEEAVAATELASPNRVNGYCREHESAQP